MTDAEYQEYDRLLRAVRAASDGVYDLWFWHRWLRTKRYLAAVGRLYAAGEAFEGFFKGRTKSKEAK